MYLDFSNLQIFLMALIFVWTAFVRSSLGFGGIALGMPFMLLVHNEALFWLPIFGIHLLFFSAITLQRDIRQVDWGFLKSSGRYIVPASLLGIFGLLSLPNHFLVGLIYGFTLFYALLWMMNWTINSHQGWLDKILLLAGGYVIGIGMPGMPLISSVCMRTVAMEKMRITLFVLISTLTIIRLGTFIAADINLHFIFALCLIPTAWIGHHLGMLAHDYVMQNRELFRRVVGGALILVCSIGLIKQYLF
jgi:uncharacterized membrane protein YfcA